jgi:hypothetical protein
VACIPHVANALEGVPGRDEGPDSAAPRPAPHDEMVATNGPDVGRNLLVASACASRRAIPRRAPRAPVRQGKARQGPGRAIHVHGGM